MEEGLYESLVTERLSRSIEEANARQIDALLVGNDSITQENRSLIVELANRYHLPTVFSAGEFVEAGGLLSYSVSYPHLYYRSARLVGKIFDGAKAGDLPVEQPTSFNLVINLKTAHALGLAISEAFLLRANEVIE